MKNHGLFECNSAAEVMEVLERLNVEEIIKVETIYGCSGNELAEQIMGSKGLSDSKIDWVLIDLKQKEIDEQIRSNKVIEGLLKDISNSIDRGFENIGQSIENIPMQE